MKYVRINKMLVIILITAMCIPIVSYAINEVADKENKTFFSSDKLEAVRGETVTLTMDLNLIKYDNFEFTLTSNMELKDINTESKVDWAAEENELKIISNKSELNMNKINFYYEIPKNLEIGNKITLKGTIQEHKTESEGNNEQVENSNQDNTTVENKAGENLQTKSEKEEVTIIITVVEKQDNNLSDEKQDNEKQNSNTGKEEQNNQTDNNKENQIMENAKRQTSQSQQNSNSMIQTSQSKGQMITSNSSNQEANTYNGESNNYLSSLIISGYEINPQFNKTNNTYFITVDENKTNIDIIATSEDENAKVNIYGNENLQEGENKVLIFVTAENGEVKTYRIYITK